MQRSRIVGFLVALSGDRDALDEIATGLVERSIFDRFLQVDVPYHSPKMELIKHELLASLQALAPCMPPVPLLSMATGKAVVQPALERYVASIAAYRKNTHSELPPALRKEIVQAWGCSFERWGYAT
jgi:acyl transferase domain-containing protein